MRFTKLWSTLASGPGLAPTYERFGPVSREMLPELERMRVDEILNDQSFHDMLDSPVTKMVRDMALNSLTVEYEDGTTNTVRFIKGDTSESIDFLIKLTRRVALES
jgi:hypothetical protein